MNTPLNHKKVEYMTYKVYLKTLIVDEMCSWEMQCNVSKIAYVKWYILTFLLT